jgi:uncharacterized phage-like protein YoqJ
MVLYSNKEMILSTTGHRKIHVNGYSPYSKEIFDMLVLTAEQVLSELKPTKVLSGLALNWDQSVCQACINLGIPYIGASPFLGQERKWPESSQKEYRRFVAAAENVVIVSEGGYAAWKMQVRNCYLVDNSDKLLALWDGSEGGTGNAVHYARRINKEIINCWSIFEAIKNLSA